MFPVLVVIVHELSQMLFQPRDVPREFEAPGAKTLSDQRPDCVPLRLAHFCKAHSLPRRKMHVGPATPLVVFHGKQHPRTLLVGERGEQRLCRSDDGLRGYARRVALEEPWPNLPVRSDADKLADGRSFHHRPQNLQRLHRTQQHRDYRQRQHGNDDPDTN